MTILFTVVVVLHGLIHLMGVAKAFGYGDLPQLTQPISPAMGAVWLMAVLLLLATGAAVWMWPRWWWLLALLAVVVSQTAIATSWQDAKFGTVANAIVLVGVVFGVLAGGPGSLREQYEDDVAAGLARAGDTASVTEDDLAHLPAPVARYLRVVGVVGQPRVRNMRARMHGRIRSGPDAAWMTFAAEQYNFHDQPTRFFYLTASRMGLPIQGYHRFADGHATMVIKLAAAFPVARESGPQMTQAETVTLFNDMCLFAPATLIDPAIVWRPVDDRTVAASFTHAGHTIGATLTFNEAGQLVDFVSDDRWRSSSDGSPMRQVRWSTPTGPYRPFGRVTLSSTGEARWHEAGGSWAYIEITLDAVDYNLTDF